MPEFSQVEISIERWSDRQAFEAFQKVVADVGGGVASFSIKPLYRPNAQDQAFADSGELAQLLPLESVIIDNFVIGLSGGGKLLLWRNIGPNQPPPYSDRLFVSAGRRCGTYTHILDLAKKAEPPTDGILSRTIYQDDKIKAVVFSRPCCSS